MYDTRFTAQSFATPRAEYQTVCGFTPESIAKGLRDLAKSVESRETFLEEITSSESVSPAEFTHVTLTMRYPVGDFSNHPQVLGLREKMEIRKEHMMEIWWEQAGKYRFKR
jgi:hypothetical protein